MLLNDFVPDVSLREFVQCFRIVHFNFQEASDIPSKLYPPKPENCLHFFLRDGFALSDHRGGIINQPAVLFAGQQTTVRRQHNGPDFLDAQVVFQPTAVFRLIGVPATELIDQYIEADQLFPTYVNEISEQLQAFSSYHNILTTLESFVRRLIRSANSEYHMLDTVVTCMRTGTADQSVDAFARHACLSTRQFERKFLQRVGIHPKAYSKLIRFNRAYNFKNRFPDQSWLGIAMGQGYHDYQHLVKEYKHFTGMGPRELHLIESNSPESVLGLAKGIYRKRVQT